MNACRLSGSAGYPFGYLVGRGRLGEVVEGFVVAPTALLYGRECCV